MKMLFDPTIERYPRPTILKTLDIFRERNLKSIVEIGCMRMRLNHPLEELNIICCNDGHSTIYWANETDDFVTVDTDSGAMLTSITEVKRHLGKDIRGIVMDGIEYLRDRRKEPIDLLFLDFVDANYPESAQAHLDAYIASKKNLHDKSLILVDDTDVELREDGKLHFSEDGIGGKGKLLVPYALNEGWNLIFKGRQVLLSR